VTDPVATLLCEGRSCRVGAMVSGLLPKQVTNCPNSYCVLAAGLSCRLCRCVLMRNTQRTTTSLIQICNRQSPQWLRLLQRYRRHVAPLEFSPPPASSGLSFRRRREAVVIN
jgi:hypothetical protein